MIPDQTRSALVVVDIQNDFCPGGALAVKDGDAVIEPANRLMAAFKRVVLTQDWHTAGHASFAASWPGHRAYETVTVDGIPQMLWPEHCVRGTGGADFHAALRSDGAGLVLRKGFHPRLDSYSAFFENDRTTPTGLAGWLREVGVDTLFIAGLATDYCVLYTVLDALRSGFKVVVASDAIRGVDVPGGSVERAIAAMKQAGASFATSGEILQ